MSASSDEEELARNVETQLGDLDLSSLDKIVQGLGDSEKETFGSSFVGIVKKFLNSEDASLYSNFLPYSINVIFGDVLEYIPYFALIIVFCISFSLIGGMSSDKNKSLNNLIHIIFFSAIAVIVLKIILSLMNSTSNVIYSLQSQMEVVFPVLLTITTAIGGNVTASTFQPMLAVLTTGIAFVFRNILLPIFVFSVIFGVVGNVSKNVKLDKFSKFFSSLFGWIVGIIFTIFVSFLTISGLTASSADSISFRTAKFAIKSYVPLLGSYLADGINVILASSVLVKNAVGVSALMLLMATVFAPIIKIIVVILLLKLTSAILEPLCDKEVPDFLFSLSKSLNMLIVTLVAISVMYLISLSMLMCLTNII